MKKIINLKEVMIILLSVILISMSTTVLATGDLVLGDNNTSTITGNEYDNAQTPEEDKNNLTNNTSNITNNASNTTNNTTNNSSNNAKTYNTNNKKDDLPQTGIEDYNIGILLIICVASAIFAYKKVNDYKNV